MNSFKKPVLDLVGRTCCNSSIIDAITKARNSKEYKGCIFSLSHGTYADKDYLIKKVQTMGNVEKIPDVEIAKVYFHQ
jgi:hypothetical protein